jgi:8-oxo-dGTP pyrophosphatase MutT (NUDIX family)
MVSTDSPEIMAAGGLIISGARKLSPQGRLTYRVVLVHRPKYDDWSIPKGKSNSGETLDQTALREVEEETGLRCRIVRPIAEIRYAYRSPRGDTKSKLVQYFLMEPTGGEIRVDGTEIDSAEWVDTEEALDRLTYDRDKRLLRDFLQAEPKPGA